MGRSALEGFGGAPPRRHGWWWVLIVLVLAAAGAAVYFLVIRRDGAEPTGEFARPESVQLPAAPDDDGATSSYLAGPSGQMVRQLLVVTAPLNERIEPTVCASVIDSLKSLGAPADVMAAAVAIPDQPTEEMAVAHLDAVKRALASCSTAPLSPDEVRFTSTVLQRRIEDLT